MSGQDAYDFSDLKICNTREKDMEEGKWVKFHNMELCIARYNNKAFLKKLAVVHTAEADYDMSMKEALSGTVLTNWRGFDRLDEEGETVAVEFTEDNAFAVLKNDEFAFEFVASFSRNNSNYMSKQKAILKKK